MNGVDDYPERGLNEQGLVFPRDVGVQEREASINEELHDEIVQFNKRSGKMLLMTMRKIRFKRKRITEKKTREDKTIGSLKTAHSFNVQ